MSAPSGWAEAVLAHARSHPARLGSSRLVCIDGPSGSGKSTLAHEVAGAADAPLIRMDDLYPGWQGLFDVDPHVLGVLAPLAEGEPGTYRRYEWHVDAYAEEHEVRPAPLLVLEGVGAGNRAWRDLVTTLVWVEAPADVRLARSIARDGEGQRANLVAWMRDEERLYADQGTRAVADLVVETGVG